MASSTSQNSKRLVPASLSRYFKTTAKAQRLMDPDGRICVLDRRSVDAELVFSTHLAYHFEEWKQDEWSQCSLAKAADDDPTMRISRKPPRGLMKIELYDQDFYNNTSGIENKAVVQTLSGHIDHNTPSAVKVDVPQYVQEIGFEQAKRPWIYLISEKMAPDDHERFSPPPFPNPKAKILDPVEHFKQQSHMDAADEMAYHVVDEAEEDMGYVLVKLPAGSMAKIAEKMKHGQAR